MRMTARTGLVASLAFAAVMLCGCEDTTPLNNSPPAYIKEVVAYREGHGGMMVYLVFRDASGRETTADGVLTLVVSETEGHGRTAHHRELMRADFSISRSQFRRTTIGQGPFARDAVILSLGRIVHSDFRLQPVTGGGEVQAFFRPASGVAESGQVLEGKTTVTF